MTGLEKILKVIEDEAKSTAATILAEAKREADEILALAKQEAQEKVNQIAEKSDMDIKAALNRAESAAALQEKKIILNAKQQIISNIIASAKASLSKMSDSEYLDILLKMVKRYAHNKQGKILFSSADKKRLPKEFDQMLKQALADRPEASLTVAEDVAPFEGGFLLVYGDIEENCSFDAMFASAKESLQDKVNSMLFE